MRFNELRNSDRRRPATAIARVSHQFVACLKRTAERTVGSGTMYPWLRSRTREDVTHSLQAGCATHHLPRSSVLHPHYSEKCGLAAVLLVLALAGGGCRPQAQLPATYAVRGNVVFSGGRAVSGGGVHFQSQADAAISASGEIGARWNVRSEQFRGRLVRRERCRASIASLSLRRSMRRKVPPSPSRSWPSR